MSDTHKLIEVVLEQLRETHSNIDREIEYLFTSGRCEEDDVQDLKKAVVGLFKLNRDVQDLLVAVLEPDYDSAAVRKNLLDLRLMNAMKRGADRTLGGNRGFGLAVLMA
jgi:hypothetical protein